MVKLGDEFIRIGHGFYPIQHGTHYWNGARIVRKPRPIRFWKWTLVLTLALTFAADWIYCGII